MTKEMHCIHKNNFRPFGHDVNLTKKYNKNTNWNTKESVTPSSMISQTLWHLFLPICQEQHGGDELSLFCSKPSPKTQGKREDGRCKELAIWPTCAHLVLK